MLNLVIKEQFLKGGHATATWDHKTSLSSKLEQNYHISQQKKDHTER